MLKKITTGTLLAFVFLFFFVKPGSASLVEVKKDGQVVVGVLSQEDIFGEDATLEVKQIANGAYNNNSDIILSKDTGVVSMKVGYDREFVVENWNDELVEIEERPSVRRVKVGVENEDFIISQQGVRAATDFGITIDPIDGRFLLETKTGKKFLAVLPYEIAQTTLRTRFINKLANEPLVIMEDDNGLYYQVKGEKVLELGFYDIKFPVSLNVSAQTGEVQSVSDPNWLKFLSILFV